MTTAAVHRLQRVERAALIVAVLALIIAVVLAVRAPHDVVPAWRLALFICLQPALGSLVFILIYRLTGGQWMEGLAPFLLAGARMLPWIWVLILPLLWFPMAAQPREPAGMPELVKPMPLNPVSQTYDADAALRHVFESGGSRHMGAPLEWYFSHPMLVVRGIVYALAFFLLAFGARRALHATTTLRWFGPLGLIGLVILLHLLATDWLNLLDPGWYSTAFPLVWITAQAVAGMAAAVGAAILFGADPAATGSAKHIRGIDWGNLLLASILSWAYVSFLQFLIIWSGNMPAETAWYRHRAYGGWRWLLIGFAIVEFGAPFFLLLSRAAKQRRRGLGVIAVILLLGQIAFTTWLIAPAFPDAVSGAPLLLVAMLVAGLALFFNRYLAGARTHAALLPS